MLDLRQNLRDVSHTQIIASLLSQFFVGEPGIAGKLLRTKSRQRGMTKKTVPTSTIIWTIPDPARRVSTKSPSLNRNDDFVRIFRHGLAWKKSLTTFWT